MSTVATYSHGSWVAAVAGACHKPAVGESRSFITRHRWSRAARITETSHGLTADTVSGDNLRRLFVVEHNRLCLVL